MSADAELYVIGALLHDNPKFWQVAEMLAAEDFTDATCRRVYGLIADQLRAGQPADPVTLGDVAGDGVRNWCVQHCGWSSASVVAHAEIVKRNAERARIKRAGLAIVNCESYEDAQRELMAVRPRQAQKMKSAMDGLREMVEAIQRRYDADGAMSGITTGMESLDKLTAGWQAGDLIIVAARPSMGKTAFALQSAMAAGRAVFFSLEMTAGKLAERATANLGDLPYRWIRFPLDEQTPDYASARVMEAAKLVGALPLLIDDSAGLSVDAICSRARQVHMAEPVKLIIIDHLGLIARAGKHDASELGQITTQLKALAKELAVPVVLLCQLNRGVEARNDKRPQLSDLRDSGRIEEDADLVIALYRDEYHNPDSPLKGYVECLIRKARDGELGTAWGKSKLANMRIESCDEPEQPVSQASSNNQRRGFAARDTQGRDSGAVARIGGNHG
jgi:replicative DNA helicase